MMLMRLDLQVKQLLEKRLWMQRADTLKKLSYELGGKNPNIIFADC